MELKIRNATTLKKNEIWQFVDQLDHKFNFGLNFISLLLSGFKVVALFIFNGMCVYSLASFTGLRPASRHLQ